MAIKKLTAVVGPDDVGRADAIVRKMTNESNNYVRALFDHGCVSLAGAPLSDGGHVLNEGDKLGLRYDPTQRYKPKKNKEPRIDNRSFSILFEDEHLIVVNKNAGVLTVPTDRKEPNTVVGRLSQYMGPAGRSKRAWVIHRLDRDVSGVLVFAKDRPTSSGLIHQFKDHKPERKYVSIVAGLMEKDHGTFSQHLATAKNLQRYVAPPSEKSERAVTHYEVKRRLQDTTLVEITLETGKRNQIRVHFAYAGHPVLGDSRYEPERAAHKKWRHKRIALHAQSLGFVHPITERAMSFEAPLPPEFVSFLKGRR